jgi:hypothetical protein
VAPHERVDLDSMEGGGAAAAAAPPPQLQHATAHEAVGPHEEIGLGVVATFCAGHSGLFTVYATVLKYKYVREKVLAHILGGRDKDEGQQEAPLSITKLRRYVNGA